MRFSLTPPVITALALSCVAAGALFFFYRHLSKERYTVGLVYCPSSIFHEQLMEAVKRKISRDERFRIKEFPVASVNDTIASNAVCNTAMESDVDVILSCGITCSQGITQAARKRPGTAKVVFVGINDPVAFGLVSSLETPEKTITGIASQMEEDTFNPAQLLLYTKPRLKKVLIPYLATDKVIEENVHIVATMLSKAGAHATILPIYDIAEAMPLIAGSLPGHDTLMYVQNDGVAACAPALGKLASQHNVTMFANSIDDIQDSALSYYANPTCLAKIAFEMIKKVTLEHQTFVPIAKAIVKRYFRINIALCPSQDLDGINPVTVASAIRKDERLASVHRAIIVS